jgi:dipeptidyl aminopeptidase/acylaminoacyl peptidase
VEGNLRLGFRVTEDGGSEILRVDGSELTPILTCTVDETCEPIQFHKAGERVYLATNKGDRDLAELVLLDPANGEMEFVERDPEGKVDFSNAIFSRATDELIATSYNGARLRIYPKDPTFKQDLANIRKALPRGDLLFRQPTKDDRLWIVKPILDTDNGPNYLYDRATGKVVLLYRPYPNIPIEQMAEMEPVTYTARDGVEIPAYLTLPKGVEPKNLATVIMPHGGPWARDTWGWNPLAQLLANRGYAVLQPNFRGSTGYGKKFLELGNEEWGTGAMQHDITDGANWLVEKGIADPNRIAIMGGSYGGYATLAGVAFTPDLYAAGVSIVGPSSIITLLNSIPPYWAPIKKIFHARVGDPEDPSDLERLRAQSPLYSAEDITTPLMVIQGANDPRVKQAESDQIVIALRDLERTVEYLVAQDEGHGFANALNNLASYAAIERFLAENVGGRYQSEMRPEIADKLDEITVDIESVEIGMRE